MKLLRTSLLMIALNLAVVAQSTYQPAPLHTRARVVTASPKTKAVTKPKEITKPKIISTRQEIENIEHDWAQALLDEDVTKLETILSDNLQYTRSNGKVENKSGYLKSLRDGITHYSLVKRDNTKIIVNGDTAIVTARWKARLQNKPNPPLETTARYTHVYVKKDGRWQLTTHQSTEIK